MSYMDYKAFVQSNGIHELTLDEIEYVAGGPGPLAPALAAGAACAKNTTCRNAVKATVVAIAGVAAAIFGYENNRV